MAAKKQQQERTCLCGCGESVKGRFRPGHDARLKGALIRRFRDGDQAAWDEAKVLGDYYTKALSRAVQSTPTTGRRRPTRWLGSGAR